MKSLFTTFTILAASLVVGHAAATTIAINPVSDAFAKDFDRNGVYDELFPDSPANIVGTSSEGIYGSSLEFALTGIPENMAVDSAILQLQRVATVTGGLGQMDMYVHFFAGNGNAELNDLTIDQVVAGPFLLKTNDLPDFIEIDVTNAIRALHDAREVHAGLSLRVNNVLAPLFILQFGSVENSVDRRPVLEVAYSVPELPGCAQLVSAILVQGVIYLSRCRRIDFGAVL